MLQQTQAKTVIPYYDRFLKRFPDLESLARSSEHDVLELWSGLGYYSRARNLHRAAKLIIARHGEFPSDFAAILALPGIGRYTAGAICSLAFDQVQPVVDGNVRRVVTRLEGIRGVVPEKFFWQRMRAWIPEKYPSAFNQAMMELGALICAPQNPLCHKCPVALVCEARRRGIQGKVPAARVRRKVQHTKAVILILRKQHRILLTSLQKPAIVPGEWGFPCCLILHGESVKKSADALCRNIVGRALELAPFAKFSHSITNHRITAYGFFQEGDYQSAHLRSADGLRWATFSECGPLLTSSLFRKALERYLSLAGKD